MGIVIIQKKGGKECFFKLFFKEIQLENEMRKRKERENLCMCLFVCMYEFTFY